MGRPRTRRPIDTAAVEREWPPCDPATICPTVTRKGNTSPDGFNHPFSRHVPREEAMARGWSHFFIGDVCRAGHVAPRPVSNPDACVDCRRVAEGKTPIGATARHQTFNKPTAKPATPATLPVPLPAQPEPDARDKRFLTELAATRSFDAAAANIGVATAAILARMSYSAPFRDAVNRLADELAIPRPVPLPTDFAWDAEKRSTLRRVWIDSGDLKTARDAIGCSPSHLFEELEQNPEFAAAYDRAKPLAARALEDAAVSLSLKGNDRLLQKVLAAKIPDEYRDSVNLHVNPYDKLTDEQLRQRILHMLGGTPKGSPDVIDAEIIEQPGRGLLPAQPVREGAADSNTAQSGGNTAADSSVTAADRETDGRTGAAQRNAPSRARDLL